MILRYLKKIYPSVPGEIKDSARLNKVLDGDEDWRTTKDILRQAVYTKKGDMLLSSKCKDKLLSFIDPHTHVAAW